MTPLRNGLLTLAVLVGMALPPPLAWAGEQTGSAAAMDEAADAPFPFSRVVALSLANNPALAQARAGLAGAEYGQRAALAPLLPQLGLSLNHSGRQTRWQGQTLTSDPDSASLSLSQVVFNRSRLLAHQAATPRLEAARGDLEAARQGIILQAAQVAIGVIQAAEVARLAASNLEVTQRHLQATRNRFQVGEITHTDVSRADARVASAEAARIRADNDLAVSRARYREVVGEEAPDNLAAPAVHPQLLAQVAQDLQRAVAERPDLQAQQARLTAAELGVKQASAGHLPTLDLSASATRNPDGELYALTDPVDYYQVGVTLTLPLYAGGGTSAATGQARATRDGERAGLAQLRLAAQREARQALLEHRSAQAALRAYQVAVKAAEEALSGVEEEYRVGSRTALDLLDAQNALFSAQTDRTTSHYTELLSRFRLLQAAGRLTPEAVADGAPPAAPEARPENGPPR